MPSTPRKTTSPKKVAPTKSGDRKLTTIEGSVYDITDFIPNHPGGQIIESVVGMDGTVLFNNHHPFLGDIVRQKLKQFYVGPAQASDNPLLQRSAFFDELQRRIMETGTVTRDRSTVLFGIESMLTIVVCLSFVGMHLAGISKFISFCTPVLFTNFSMAVMHPALHKGCTSPVVNWICNTVAIAIGAGGTQTWKFSHTQHHAVTMELNDPDLFPLKEVIRYVPEIEHKWYHAYQPVYAWLIYALTGHSFLFKSFAKEPANYLYKHLARIPKVPTESRHIFEIACGACSFLFRFTPFFYLPWDILCAFEAGLLVAGFMLATVFQINHFTHKVAIKRMERIANGTAHKDWAVDQIEMSNNFSTENWLMGHFTGGLNFQIEHHLFPTLNIWHYAEINEIVKKMCVERNVSYQAFPSYFTAVKDHMKLLVFMATARKADTLKKQVTPTQSPAATPTKKKVV